MNSFTQEKNNKNEVKIYVAGHKGMVGSSIIRRLNKVGYQNIVTKTRKELDLTNQSIVEKFFEQEKIDQIYLCAAKVGGIHANNEYPADFIYQNLSIELNIINCAYKFGIKKLLFLGSSCIYPKNATQPIKEKYLLDGKLEPTNEPYAIAKIAGIKLCESYNRQFKNSDLDYRCLMPTNLYGPGDKYHPENSHVIPSLLLKFHEAKINNLPFVEIWGSGKPRREFLYVDDLAYACVHIMNLKKDIYDNFINPMISHINVGTGEDLTIHELAILIKKITNYDGKLVFDETKPDGTPQKLLNIDLIKSLGWSPTIGLREGLKKTYRDFIKTYE